MFHYSQQQSGLAAASSILRLIFHNTVRHVRKNHGNPLLGLVINMLQTLILVLVFVFMFSVLGLRGNAIRGDFILYIMTGIFLFLTHNKALGDVAGSESATSPMMQHGHCHHLGGPKLALHPSFVCRRYFDSLLFGLGHRHVPVSAGRFFNDVDCLVFRRRHWHGSLGAAPVVSPVHQNRANNLFACQYDHVGQNVCCQSNARLHHCNVLLEPAVPLYRSSPWIHLCKLHAPL
jgi:hypothetical protein